MPTRSVAQLASPLLAPSTMRLLMLTTIGVAIEVDGVWTRICAAVGWPLGNENRSLLLTCTPPAGTTIVGLLAPVAGGPELPLAATPRSVRFLVMVNCSA